MRHKRGVDMDHPLPKADRDICAINKDANRPFQNSEKCQSGQRVLTSSHSISTGCLMSWWYRGPGNLHSQGACFNLFRIYFGVYGCVYVREHRYPQKPKEGIWLHAAKVIDSWEPACGFWELNLHPLKRQQVLLAPEPPLQLQAEPFQKPFSFKAEYFTAGIFRSTHMSIPRRSSHAHQKWGELRLFFVFLCFVLKCPRSGRKLCNIVTRWNTTHH